MFNGTCDVPPAIADDVAAVAYAAETAYYYVGAVYSAFDVTFSHTSRDIDDPNEWRVYICDYAAKAAEYFIEAAMKTIAAKEQMRRNAPV